MRWPTIGSVVDDWQKARGQWRLWFAWFPVPLTESQEWVWWETIERRKDYVEWYYRQRREENK